MLTKRVQTLFSPEEYRKLKELSRRKKSPMGEIIRTGVKRLCEEEKKGRRAEAFERLNKLDYDLPGWEALEEDIIKGKLHI